MMVWRGPTLQSNSLPSKGAVCLTLQDRASPHNPTPPRENKSNPSCKLLHLGLGSNHDHPCPRPSSPTVSRGGKRGGSELERWHLLTPMPCLLRLLPMKLRPPSPPNSAPPLHSEYELRFEILPVSKDDPLDLSKFFSLSLLLFPPLLSIPLPLPYSPIFFLSPLLPREYLELECPSLCKNLEGLPGTLV